MVHEQESGSCTPGSNCLFSFGWSIPESEGQLLPPRPLTHDLPAPSRPPCACALLPVTPFSSPRPSSCKISCDSHTPGALSPQSHTAVLSLKCVPHGGDEET